MIYRAAALALFCAGIMWLSANALMLPMLRAEQSTLLVLLRLSLAAAAVLLMLPSVVGLHARQRRQSKALDLVAFALTFVGTTAMFAHEWAKTFFFIYAPPPAATQAVLGQKATALSGYDIWSLGVLYAFALGWISFSMSMLRARVLCPRGPILLIAGFCAVPLLTAAARLIAGATHEYWGGLAGNAILSFGWIVLAVDLNRSAQLNGAGEN